MAKIIGIDLGTSNSAAAYMEAGKPRISSPKCLKPALTLKKFSNLKDFI